MIKEIELVLRVASLQGTPAEWRDSRVTKNYKGLFEHRNFENTITKLELFYIAGKGRSNGLIKRANDIIQTIDQDLKNR